MYLAIAVVFLAVYLVLPGVTLAWRNSFQSAPKTLLRALVAVGLTWSWLVGGAMALTQIDMWLASSAADAEAAMQGDGARHSGALLLGWLPSLVVVILSWILLRLWRAIRARVTRRSAA